MDIEDFRRWALGNLAENRNRGVFAEWLVAQALEAIDDHAARQEWMPWDLESEPATNENVIDPAQWRFWVVSRLTLDDELGPQQSVGPTTLDRLVKPIRWSEIKAAVNECIEEVPV